MEYLTVILWSTIGSILSLIGGLILISHSKVRASVRRWALPFGAGALLAAAFISALPEALEHGDVGTTLLFTLGGFLGFFLLERFIGWFHHHHHHDDVHGARDKAHVAMVIAGDTLHNAIDGLAIGAAFLVNPAVGITTSLAIAAHEIPQEISDFGILLAKGMRPRRVILVNVLSALTTVVMAVLAFWLGGLAGIDPAPLMATAAGMFIYIAASDLIPDIHEQPHREGNLQSIMLFVGVIVISTASMLIPHEHAGEVHSSEETTEQHDSHGAHDEHNDEHLDTKPNEIHSESEDEHHGH